MDRFPTLTRSHRRDDGGRWTQGDVPWPGGARCVFVLAIDYDGPSHDVGQGFVPLGARSTGRYSARRGVPRLLDMLSRVGIPATFFVPGYDAQDAPDSIRDIDRAGHEVGAHGYLHERILFPPDEEERRLVLTHDILSDLLGRAPVGWRSPSGQKTHTTLKVLHRLGYRYDTSDKDFDVPYMLDLGGASMVEIPNNTSSLDDHPWFHVSLTPASEVLAVWRQEFDAIYAERGFYFLSIHPRCGWGSGTPSRTAAVESLIRYAMAHRDVAFLTLAEVCDWVLQQPDGFEAIRV